MELRGWGWRYRSFAGPSKGYVELSVKHGGRPKVLQNKFHRGGALLVIKGLQETGGHTE
jgi:hypothetical protein